MALQLSLIQFKKGSYIVVEGKYDADFFFIVREGLVQCTKSSDGNPVRYGPGDFIGVVPCMSGHAQIETAMALTDVTVISVKKEQYPELISNNTPLALKIIKSFASRMRVMNDILAQNTLNNVSSDTSEQIYNVAKYYDNAGKTDVAVYAYYQFLKTRPTGQNAENAKKRFIALKPRAKAVYYEPTADMNREYPKGSMIFSESQSGAEMYIIQEGQVSISKVVDGQEVVLAVLKQGDMFGEMALLENKPRSASALAHDDCRLMVVNRKNFNQMVATQSQLIARLTTTLAERLWSMYRQIENSHLKDPVHKMIDMMALQIEKQKIQATKPNIGWQSQITAQDVANMCGIPQMQVPKAVYDFQNLSFIRINDGKVYVKDCYENIKQAEFYRSNDKK